MQEFYRLDKALENLLIQIYNELDNSSELNVSAPKYNQFQVDECYQEVYLQKLMQVLCLDGNTLYDQLIMEKFILLN